MASSIRHGLERVFAMSDLDTDNLPLDDGKGVSSTILLVDDDPNILASLKRVFKPEGYVVLTAESGKEAVGVLENVDVDLILSDIKMPHMTGVELLEVVSVKWPDIVRILMTGYADIESTIEAINKGHIYSYISKPWDDNDVIVRVRNALQMKLLHEEKERLQNIALKQNIELQQLNSSLEQRVRSRTEELKQTNMFLELAYEQLKESYFDAIPIFASLVQLREGDVNGHSKRVAELSREVGLALKLPKNEIRHVYFAGLLHDIGKIGLPDELLKIPYAKMNSGQKKMIHRHPTIGASVLMGLEPLHLTSTYIRSHHEIFDGKGFPDGLQGDEIPLGARVLMVCNEFDQLRSGTLIGDDLSVIDAIDYMKERAGKRYDKRVLGTLFAVLKNRERGSVHERCLEPQGLQPGMILSRDLISMDGVLLLSRNHKLNDILINKLHAFSYETQQPVIVHVYADE